MANDAVGRKDPDWHIKDVVVRVAVVQMVVVLMVDTTRHE